MKQPQNLRPAITAGLLVAVALLPAHAGDVILTGNVLKVGVNDGGGLIDSGFVVGIDQSPGKNGVFTTFDFLKPGTPYEFWSAGYDKATTGVQGYWDGSYTNSGTTTNTSSGSTLSASTTGLKVGDLSLTQALSYDMNGGFIDFTVTLTNAGTAAMRDVVYARGLDPDQDVYAGGGYSTNNLIPNGDLVTGSAPVTDWTIGIFSNSSYPHTPTVQSGWPNGEPYHLLTPHNDGNGDYSINMAWDLGALDVGQSKTVAFQYRIAETSGGVINPTPDTGSTLAMLTFGLASLMGFALRRKSIA